MRRQTAYRTQRAEHFRRDAWRLPPFVWHNNSGKTPVFCTKKKGPRTAPYVSSLKQRFKIIHPFHPLFGKEFELVGFRNSWKKPCVDFVDEHGVQIYLPLEWTDAAEIDPFLRCSMGRSHFRVEELLRLADLVSAIVARSFTTRSEGV